MVIHVTSLSDTTTSESRHVSKQALYFTNAQSESQGPRFNKTSTFPMPLGKQLKQVPESG